MDQLASWLVGAGVPWAKHKPKFLVHDAGPGPLDPTSG